MRYIFCRSFLFVILSAQKGCYPGKRGGTFLFPLIRVLFSPHFSYRKERTVKIITQAALSLALLGAGFATGFPVGKDAGFNAGSEWALMQANLLAREAGVFMPVYLEEGQFRVVIKQPRGLYKRAWQLADAKEEKVPLLTSGDLALSETIPHDGKVTPTPADFPGALENDPVLMVPDAAPSLLEPRQADFEAIDFCLMELPCNI